MAFFLRQILHERNEFCLLYTSPLNMYEESVKVPFIARHPGRIPAGVVCDSLVSAYDFMPTLLDYLGDVYKRQDGRTRT